MFQKSPNIEIDRLSEKLKTIFIDYPYIAAAYLFGSQIKGIAILIKEDAPKGRELEAVCKSCGEKYKLVDGKIETL